MDESLCPIEWRWLGGRLPTDLAHTAGIGKAYRDQREPLDLGQGPGEEGKET